MKLPKEYFDLTIEELQSLANWAADCAERSLHIYESLEKKDSHPRQAIVMTREFVTKGKRTNALRKIAFEAYRSSLSIKDSAASAAAQAASLAAASAYTHPFKDIHQVKHILGPAAYSALAVEIQQNNDPAVGEREIEWAVTTANNAIAELLKKMPEYDGSDLRINQLFSLLNRGIRSKFM